jgi:cAMP-specific phosphodiesterase 4
MSKSEIGFTQFIVKPLWESLNRFLGDDLRIFIDNLENNMKEWQKIHEKSLPESEKTVAASDQKK